jgi:hypothetical protein
MEVSGSNNSWNPLDWSVSALQSKSGRCREQPNLIPPPKSEPRFLGHLARNLVSMLTEMFPTNAAGTTGPVTEIGSS